MKIAILLAFLFCVGCAEPSAEPSKVILLGNEAQALGDEALSLGRAFLAEDDYKRKLAIAEKRNSVIVRRNKVIQQRNRLTEIDVPEVPEMDLSELRQLAERATKQPIFPNNQTGESKP